MPKNNLHLVQGFAPIVPDTPKIMILGTMPSVKSLEEAFYYAHPRNAFWPILQKIAGCSVESVSNKTSLCKALNIFLWDVLQACERQGSLDTAIKQPQANDFESVFKQFPKIEVVFFNGQAAAKLFQQQVVKTQALPAGLLYQTLPSTSPANAKMKIEDKCLIWEEKLRPFL